MSGTGGNPQGKGMVPVLDEWRGAQAGLVEAKPVQQLLTDYFVTLLVLSAEFNFKPVRGTDYYLFLAGTRWKLSLISPEEWGERAPGPCLGQCRLLADMTWTISPQDNLDASPEVRQALQAFHRGFLEMLDSANTLEAGLPHYVSNLPFYRRLLAAGLAGSLARSLELGGLTRRPAGFWLEAAGATPLLASAEQEFSL